MADLRRAGAVDGVKAPGGVGRHRLRGGGAFGFAFDRPRRAQPRHVRGADPRQVNRAAAVYRQRLHLIAAEQPFGVGEVFEVVAFGVEDLDPFGVADVDLVGGADGDEARDRPFFELPVAGPGGALLADVPRGGGAEVAFGFAGAAFFAFGLVHFAAEHQDEAAFGVELLHAVVVEVHCVDIPT